MELIYQQDFGQRLDKYLTGLNIKELYSRSLIDNLIEQGKIMVNGDLVKKSHQLKRTDRITIEIPPREKTSATAQAIDLKIVYQDEWIVIIDKPAGLTVHPAPGNRDGTLVNALVHHFGTALAAGSKPDRPGIVHRLDKDTSGLIIVAKDDRTHALLSRLFQERKISKTYQAITVGIPQEDQGTITTMMNRSRTDRKKMAVTQSGREAVTRYKISEYFDYFALLEIDLITGRTHQIRVHFSHLNCPILGDRTYNSLKRTLSMLPGQEQRKVKDLLSGHLNRQALHCSQLRFSHPWQNREMQFNSEPPEDFQYALTWLRKHFKA